MKKTLYLIISAIMTFFLISLSIAAVLIFWSNKGLDNELPLLLLLLAMIAAIGLPFILARRSKHSLDLQHSKRSESTSYTTIAAGTQGHFKTQANPEIAKELKIPRIGVQLTEKVYIPLVKSFMPAKVFELASYTCIVFTACEAFDSEYQYLHILFAYGPPDGFSIPCFAVSSSTNDFITRYKEQGENLSGSYTLGVFPCDGKTRHINLGLSDEWADLDKFTEKALSLAQEHLGVTVSPQEVSLPPQARERISFAKERMSPDS